MNKITIEQTPSGLFSVSGLKTKTGEDLTLIGNAATAILAVVQTLVIAENNYNFPSTDTKS